MPTPGARSAVRYKHEDRPLLDTTIDQRYFVEEQLGDHPAGAIYQARQLVLRLPVALVVVHRRLSQNNRLVRDFKAEVAEAARVISPHAMPLTDLGRVPDRRIYFTRGILPGETLETRLVRAGRLTEAAALAILEQLEDVLSEMHAVDLVHGALRPDNIFLFPRRGTDFVKLLDVGCSTLAAASGSPTIYMAPEQQQGGAVDALSDLYSLALVGHEMVTGQCPAPAPGSTATPRSPQRVVPELSESFSEAISAALDPDPARRPATVRALVDDLGRAARDATPRRQVVIMQAPQNGGTWVKGHAGADGAGGEAEQPHLGRVTPASFGDLLRSGAVLPKPATRPHRVVPGDAMTLQETLSDGAAQGWVPVPRAGLVASVEGSPARSVDPATVQPAVVVAAEATSDGELSTTEPSGEPRATASIAGSGEDAAPVSPGAPGREAALPAGGLRASGPQTVKTVVVLIFLAALVAAIWILAEESGEKGRSSRGLALSGVPRRAPGLPQGSRVASPRPPHVAGRGAGVGRAPDAGRIVAMNADFAGPAGLDGAATPVAASLLVRRRRQSRRAPRSPDAGTRGASPVADAAAAALDAASVETEIKALLDAARKAYVAGLYEQALGMARRLLKLRPGNRDASQIMGVSACHLSDAHLARRAYRRLGARRRGLLVTICQRAGVSLEEPVAPKASGSSPPSAAAPPRPPRSQPLPRRRSEIRHRGTNGSAVD